MEQIGFAEFRACGGLRLGSLLLAFCAMTVAQPVIHLKNRTYTAGRDPMAFRGLSAKSRGGQGGHYVVQFDQAPRASDVELLRARGAVVMGYVPENALMISTRGVLSLEGLAARWGGRLERNDKISPLLVPSGLGQLSENEMGAFLVEFGPDVSKEDRLALAKEYNLQVEEHASLIESHLMVTGLLVDVMRLAEWDEVMYIFPASEDLLRGNTVVACAGAVTEMGSIGQYVAKVSEGWDGAGRGTAELGYVFSQLTGKLGMDAQKVEILRAMREWERVVGVKFNAGTNANALKTINILFALSSHGDGYAFDGKSGALAHTFYPAPPNDEPIAGDMHFDEAENWQIGADTDLYSVALHELGHALGLGHSDKAGSVMYPYYRRATSLTSEDIGAILQIYAEPAASAPTIPTVTPTPVPVPTPIPAPPPPSPQPSPFSLSLTTLNADTSDAAITLSGQLLSGAGPWRVNWYTAGGVNSSVVVPGSGASASFSLAGVPLSIGSNTVVVLASDSAHRFATASFSIIRKSGTGTVTPGAPSTPAAPPGTISAPPALTIVTPSSSNTQISQATAMVKGTARSDIGVAEISWNTNAGNSGKCTGTTDWTCADVPMLVGSNTVTIRAKDTTGATAWKAVTVTRR